MEVMIRKAPITARSLIDEMMQPYFAELEQFAEIGTNKDGRYEYAYLDSYWSEPESRYPFLIQANGNIAGFVLVSRHSRLRDDQALSISEFFIATQFRRHGVGSQAASQTFLHFGGKWEVGTLERNRPAREFWEAVIADVASGKVTIHNDIWKGPVYAFTVTPNLGLTP